LRQRPPRYRFIRTQGFDMSTTAAPTADLAAFRAALRTACEAALDDGFYYQEPFMHHVLETIGDQDPAEDVFLGTVRRGRDDLEAFASRIAASPRGTWGLVETVIEDEEGRRTYYRPVMSEGTGDLPHNSDSYEAPPGYAKVYERMVGFEIYLVRKEIQEERAHAARLEALQTHGIRTGAVFRNLHLNGTLYSTVRVTGVSEESGYASVFLVRRGSKNRWTGSFSAAALAHAIGEAARLEQRPQPGGTR
jgi:hypothetical protein